MSRGRDLELTISSAKNIKNVNWRLGPNRPYAVVWVDPRNKFSTRVDENGDTSPTWNETLTIPLPPDNQDDDGNKLYIDILHAGNIEDAKPFIGSTSLKLNDVIEEVGFGVPLVKTLKLKRSSGRPHGKIDVIVHLREAVNYSDTRSYHTEPYSAYQTPPQPGYGAPPQYGYGAPPQPDYGGQYAPPQNQYDASREHPPYEHSGSEQKPEKEKSSSFGGMGMGLAIGATAGILGGIALSQGYEAMKDDTEDEEEEEEKEEEKEEEEEEEKEEEEEEEEAAEDSDQILYSNVLILCRILYRSSLLLLFLYFSSVLSSCSISKSQV